MPQSSTARRTRLVPVGLLAAAAAVFLFLRRPTQVVVTHPKLVSITETIASSARVGGVQESAVGRIFPALWRSCS
jgi:hypothetical protein